jgi:plastocyanin
MTKRRALVIPLITLVIMTALSAMATPAFADGGDFSTDFIAAGPFTYNHDTGVGGEYADRTISKTDGVVESLEGGDFECGDKVVYFAAVTVDAGATGEQDIELDLGFLHEPTGQPGVGHDLPLVVSANTGDSGMSGDTDNTTVSLVSSGIDTSGSTDEVVGTVAINNLDPGEVFILRVVVGLTCTFDSDPTGNLQAEIHAGRVVDPVEDAIPIGNQTVPFQSLSAISQPASVTVSVGTCVPAVGSSSTPVTVAISPSGSASVTVTGPAGYSHTFTGSGGTVSLAPGTYSWTAVAEPGFILEGPTSGSFTVADCALTPTTVTVSVGECVPAVGSSSTPVTVTIDPDSGASVTINGPGGFTHTFTGSGGTISLAPGAYTWTATAAAGHAITGASSGSFTVVDCALIPTTVSVSVGECVPAVGSSTTPVTVTIDPASGASVTVTGPDGFSQTFTGSGGSVDLAPGTYDWTATAAAGHAITGASSGSFTVVDCALTPATVSVTVGSCPATSSETKPVVVVIDPASGASVTVTGSDGFNEVVGGVGETLQLAQGSYSWTAAANEGFAIVGATEGNFAVGSCIVEVLPETFLPKTGADLPGVGTAGVAFVLVGIAMVSVSRGGRRSAVAVASVSAFANHLRGRSVWSATTPRLVLPSTDLDRSRRSPLSGWVRRRGDRTGRAGPGDG